MCQILGMNCAHKTSHSFDFSGFRQRGGKTDKHSDGFGIAFHEGNDKVTKIVDTAPAAFSSTAKAIVDSPIKAKNMISHIRYATQGKKNKDNAHPFQRELWGIQIIYCHNGDMPEFSQINKENHPLLGVTRIKDIVYTPVGETDSEAAFCAILNALNAEFDSPPSLQTLYKKIQQLCDEIVLGEEETTIFNMLFAYGEDTLFSYSWPGARPGSKVWNGLFYTIRDPSATLELVDMDKKVDYRTLSSKDNRIVVVTTKPLTKNEAWIEVRRGQCLMFHKGVQYREIDYTTKTKLSKNHVAKVESNQIWSPFSSMPVLVDTMLDDLTLLSKRFMFLMRQFSYLALLVT